MSQRRGGKVPAASSTDEAAVGTAKTNKARLITRNSEETKPLAQGSLSIDTEDETETTAASSPTLDERYEKERHALRLKHWRESPWACGLTEPTWEAERGGGRGKRHEQSFGDEDLNPDSSGCLCCSAYVCPYFGAGRVGNMVVLNSTTEWVEEVEQDEETGEEKVTRFTRPKLNVVVGPYWPMLLFVTYPLILGVSGWAFKVAILPGKKPPLVVIGWLTLTFGLIFALACTGCRDPGILYRHSKPPPQHENRWRWSEQAKTYRPRNAHYDCDTAVVVQEFDHTCPWTGTAIGGKNFFPFQMFVCLVFVCLIMDIFLITGAF